MRVLITVRTRHPTSHDNVDMQVSAHRDVFMTRYNGGDTVTEIVTSKVITLDEFRQGVEQIYGPIRPFEVEFDPTDGMTFMRGLVQHEGVQKCLYQRFDELTQNHLDDVMRALALTCKREL